VYQTSDFTLQALSKTRYWFT